MFLALALVAAAAPAGATERSPVPAVDFEAEYHVRESANDRLTPMYIRRSGGWYRFDVERLKPHLRTYAFAREGYAGGIFIFEAGAAKMAMRLASLAGAPLYDLWGKNGKRVGDMQVAGERCDLWRVSPDVAGTKPSSQLILCVTSDGVPLYQAWEGQPAVEMLRAIHVQRRPQKAALFSLPTGLEMREVPNIAAYEREVAVWVTSLATKPRPK
jgi:hypothetical protein